MVFDLRRLLDQWRPLLPDGLKFRRMLRSALSLTICVALTLPSPTSNFLGQNVFLIGTVAIYLFPKSTLGAQCVSTFIGYVGFLLGLGWYNTFHHIAIHLAYPGDRIFLYVAFIMGAWFCGFVRSKYPICYLGMNFFMLVNIFGLVGSIEIDAHKLQTFTDFIYVFTFGSLISFACCLLWPENSATNIEDQLIKVSTGVRDIVHASIDAENRCHLSWETVKEQFNGLKVSLKASELEILWTRVPSHTLSPLCQSFSPVLDGFRILDITLSFLNKYPTSFNSSSYSAAKGLIRSMGDLKLAQIELITSELTAVVHGNALPDLEKPLDSELQSISFVQRLEELEHARYAMDARSINDHEVACTVLRALDISIQICRDLQAILWEVSAIRTTCSRRRRLRLPMRWSNAPVPLTPSSSESCTSTDSMECPEKPASKLYRWRYRFASKLSEFRDSRHTQYAFKFQLVMAILSAPPFISNWRIWYMDVRGHWSMIFAMVVMEITRGIVFRSALMKGVGSLCGGLVAIIVYTLGQLNADANEAIMTTLTIPCALAIYSIALNPRFGKAGLVAALAYNLVLGVGHSTGDPWLAFLKRTGTQLVGIFTACFISIVLFPYHARKELKIEICSAADEIAMSFHDYASGGPEHPERMSITKAKLKYARELLKITKFEPSLKGRFPRDVFDGLIDELFLIVALISKSQLMSLHSTDMDAKPQPISSQQLCLAASRDVSLISHALSTKNHTIALLAYSLSQALLSSRSSARDYGPTSEDAEARQISSTIDNLRRKSYWIIAGRSLPGLLAQATPVSPLMRPSASRDVSRGRTHATSSPLQSLAFAAHLLAPPSAGPGFTSAGTSTPRTRSVSIAPIVSPSALTSPCRTRSASIDPSGSNPAASDVATAVRRFSR